jgi:tetratricopeptide (TPR) repeat protein
LATSSYALRALHRPAEARQRIDQAFAMLRATKDYPAVSIRLESDVLIALLGQADYEADLGDRRRAVQIYEQSLALVMASKPNPTGDLRDAAKLSAIYRSMANVYRCAGDPRKADTVDERRLDLWRHWEHELPHSAFVQRQMTLSSN